MPTERDHFQSDLLESAKQMRHGELVRVTKFKLPEVGQA
jgi:hypothetical protein